MKILHNKKFFTIVVIFCISVTSLALTSHTYAKNGWIGDGSSGVVGSGGGGGSNCDATSKTYRLDCAGVSWAFYKAEKTTSSALTFDNMHSDYIKPVSSPKIPARCSNNTDGGGFYHFGINAFGFNMNVWNGPKLWGHWTTLAWGDQPSWTEYKTKTASTPRQTIKEDGKTIYKFKEYVSKSKALQHYREAYKEVCIDDGGSRDNCEKKADKIESIPGGVWGFCWQPTNYHTVKVYAVDAYTGKYLKTDGSQTGTASSAASKDETVTEDKTATITAWKASSFGGDIDGNGKYTKIAGISTKSNKITAPNSSGDNAVSFDSSTREITVKKVTKNTTLYVPYSREVHLTVYDVLYSVTGSKYLTCSGSTTTSKSSACKHQVTVTVGEKGTINLANYTNYLVGVSSTFGTKGNLNNVSGNKFTTPNVMTKAGVYYANYQNTPPPDIPTPDPTDPTPTPSNNCDGGSALLAEYVKNTSVSAYNRWLSSVYAKPKDNLVYCTSYNPSSPQGSGGYNYTNYEVVGSNCGFTKPIGLAHNQANSFTTKQSKGVNSNAWFGGSIMFYDIGVPGSTAKRTHTNDYNNVPTSDVGKTIDERAETYGNTPTAANAYTTKSPDGTTSRGQCVKWVCVNCYSYPCNCRTCGCSPEGGCSICCDTCYMDTYYHYTRGYPATTNTYYSSIAQAHVPYNFENTTEITSPTDDTDQIDPNTGHHIVYAGETEEVRFTFDVNSRYNSTTDGDYATKVDNSKRQLEISYNGNTYYTNTDTETLYNTSVNGMNSYSKSYSREIIIPDLPAGTEITVRSMVYPATSGAETNWTDQGGDHQWAYSEPVTYVIAKRPSLDVWGGNVFNNSTISTSTATKYQLEGVTSYSPDSRNRNTAYLFGSWGELGMLNNGNIQGMASGASLAKTYGSIETNLSYYRRIPLTLANYPTVTTLGQSAANNRFNQDREHLLSKYFFEDTEVPDIDSDEPPLNDSGYDVGNNVFYYHSANNISIPENSINPGTTQVVFSEDNIYINGNLTYGSDINGRVNYLFGNFTNIPKLIIYAKGEINIDCSVNRIDAVLIADKVTTCANSTNEPDETIITDEANSNRLVVFGAVIANTLVANRTYGAEPGVNSISSVSPAEIIIFDPTLYRLENNTDNASQTEAASASTKLVTTYLKELSPRY